MRQFSFAELFFPRRVRVLFSNRAENPINGCLFVVSTRCARTALNRRGVKRVSH
jgi:hypothetical protein